MNSAVAQKIGASVDQVLALRAFVRVADAGSFAKAADGMNLPRSSVSKLVQDLEAHLGSKLLERSTRAVTVTDVGEAYRARAIQLLGDLEEMDAGVTEAQGAVRGRLRVDVGSSIANMILLPALADFTARHPGIELQLGIGDRRVDLVGEGVDCVIRTGVTADSTLVARKLCTLDLITCAAPSYLRGTSVPTSPADLAQGHRLLGYFSAASGRAVPFLFTESGRDIECALSPALAMNESTAHLQALLAGLGIGQTYGFMARAGLHSGALVEVLSDARPRPHPLHLVYPPGRFPSRRLRAFVDWVVALFADETRRQNQ